MSGGRGYMGNLPASQFCCEPKKALKNSPFLKESLLSILGLNRGKEEKEN